MTAPTRARDCDTLQRRAWPGVALCAGLATLGLQLRHLSWVNDTLHLGPLLLVILLGISWHAIAGLAPGLVPGVQCAKKPVLRWAVAGLGLRVSLGELWKVSAPALGVVVACTAASLGIGLLLARRLGVPEKMGMLLSVGGAVCGASAVVAADTVVQGDKNESAYAVGVITVLGTAGMVLYPLAHHVFGLDEGLYALWDGASLPEMAQVVAAGDMVSTAAAEQALVVKLARICLLAPVVFSFAWWFRTRRQAAGEANVPVVPWFLVAFVSFVVLGSTGWLDPAVIEALQRLDLWLLCVGMAGVGLQTSFADLRAAGPAPFVAATLQWLFLAVLSLGLGWVALQP